MSLTTSASPDSVANPLAGHVFSTSSSLPRLTRQSALFLDFDGTLVDIAAQPELVKVDGSLAGLLQNLFDRLGGALAIVSGRKLEDLDHFLSPAQLPAAAEHGARQRDAGGQVLLLSSPDLQDVSRVALALQSQHPGLRAEIKSAAVALHYRQAPELEELCLEAMAEAVKRTAGVELLRGKCVLEIKAAGVSKGTAIAAFMTQSPFTGRLPIFAGDDTTDESGFAAMREWGGEGIKIGDGPSLATCRCPDPAALRAWLQSSLEGLSA